jgi:methylenetetrahydrofolate reductase (NADPH)
MNEEGLLLDGTNIGDFSLLTGAVANPYLQPMELNIIRLRKKIAAGAAFIQTGAVFDTDGFGKWMEAARQKGLTEKAAIMAGVMPLAGADEARQLREGHTDIVYPG